jgi:ParB-like chromosome segregation protein Spo0J
LENQHGEIVVEFHELANLFPLIEGAEFDGLVASIRENGLREGSPIIVFEGKILDGRNRYLACKEAGVMAIAEDFEGTVEEARQFVIDANLRRRHLDASQRAMIAANLATLADGQRQGGKFADVPTQAEAASILNVGERSVRSAREVIDDGVPELIEAVERGEVSVSRAAKIASLPKDKQAARIAYDVASPPDLPPHQALRNLEYLAAGELARWIKITTPNDRTRVIRMLRECAAILEDEMERASG